MFSVVENWLEMVAFESRPCALLRGRFLDLRDFRIGIIFADEVWAVEIGLDAQLPLVVWMGRLGCLDKIFLSSISPGGTGKSRVCLN